MRTFSAIKEIKQIVYGVIFAYTTAMLVTLITYLA